MNPLSDNNILVLDGGLASCLQNKGYEVDEDPLWSAGLLHTNLQAIYNVHCDYLKAGANIITTASYQASIEGFQKHLNLNRDESISLFSSSVTIARKAIKDSVTEVSMQKPGKRIIAGSIGPYGACQSDGSEYSGQYIDSMKEEDIIEWHKPRVQALVEAGVDILAVETIPSLQEALIIVKLLEKFPINYWLSFSCKNESCTCYGNNIGQAVKEVVAAAGNKLIAIGINCSNPRFISPLLKICLSYVPCSVMPRVVYPNSGEEWQPGEGWCQTVYPPLFQFSDCIIKEWVSLGARIIGGCCRISPKDIKMIADVISS